MYIGRIKGRQKMNEMCRIQEEEGGRGGGNNGNEISKTKQYVKQNNVKAIRFALSVCVCDAPRHPHRTEEPMLRPSAAVHVRTQTNG